MLLNAVIIILQEVLEASLLISVLMAIGHSLKIRLQWLGIAFAVGILGAFIYQYHLAAISEAFDYVGQEVTNAMMQMAVYCCLAISVFFLNSKPSAQSRKLLCISMSLAVSLNIIREGSEIFIYIGSFIQQEHLLSVCIGGAIGAAIGMSVAALIYYTLVNTRQRTLLLTGQLLLALVAAAMLSQAAQLLIQADWLPASKALWDSSSFINEESIMGHLLYAIAGYEATPGAIQFSAYMFGLVSILFLVAFKTIMNEKTGHE